MDRRTMYAIGIVVAVVIIALLFFV